IEALHKESGGGDHLGVGWQLPSGALERPIPGGRLSPYVPPTPGGITREYWAGGHGTTVADVPVGTPPTEVTTLPLLETPYDIGDHYAQRVRGYVTAPVTGAYTFWVAADDVAELWLSTDEEPANKQKIAQTGGWSYP